MDWRPILTCFFAEDQNNVLVGYWQWVFSLFSDSLFVLTLLSISKDCTIYPCMPEVFCFIQLFLSPLNDPDDFKILKRNKKYKIEIFSFCCVDLSSFLIKILKSIDVHYLSFYDNIWLQKYYFQNLLYSISFYRYAIV